MESSSESGISIFIGLWKEGSGLVGIRPTWGAGGDGGSWVPSPMMLPSPLVLFLPFFVSPLLAHDLFFVWVLKGVARFQEIFNISYCQVS